MPKSIFSYNLTRKYPYGWFTWLVIVGGIAATAIFTVINLAANGYESNILYLTNPNATEHPLHLQWFEKAPWSWASKVGSSCEDVSIVVGSEFYTSNLAFSYKVTGVSRGTGNQSKPVGSFSYHNDAFSNCSMSDIVVSSYTTDNAFEALGASLGNLEPVKGQVTATMICILYEAFNPVTVSLSTTFVFDDTGVYSVQQYGPLSQFDAPTFLSTNNHTQASLMWGQALIAAHGYVICVACLQLKMCDGWTQELLAIYTFNQASFQAGDGGPGEANAAIYMDKQEFNYTSFGEPGTAMKTSSWSSMFGLAMLSHFGLYYCSSKTNSCNYLTTLQDPFVTQALVVDGLVKSVYLTILTDLGQGAPSNTLASAKQVKEFANQTNTLIVDKMALNEHNFGEIWQLNGDVFNPSFNDTSVTNFFEQAQTGMPQAIPATVSTQYLCQVPKIKSTGSLLVSIIVADLVFLQALWIITIFFMDLFLERRHPEANYCDGCAKVLASDQGKAVEMTPGPRMQGNYTQVSDPDEEPVSPILGSASASIRSGAVSARSSVRRRNDANVQPFLGSP